MNRVSKPFNRVHLLSWVLSLDSKGYIPCQYQNCNFMANNLDEMVSHYQWNSCAREFQFTCNNCYLSTDQEVKLLFHRIYVHSYNATPEERREVILFLGVKKKISQHLMKGWQVYLENKGFLKCLNRACLYVPQSLDEMEKHYMHECKEEFWSRLISECNTCGGWFQQTEHMILHREKFHSEAEKFHLKVEIFKKKHPMEEHSPIWVKQISSNKQASCPVPGCKYVTNVFQRLIHHFKICTGMKQKEYVVCSYCHCWLQNETKLLEHMKCLHKGLEIQMVKQPSCEGPTTEAQAQTQKKLSGDKNGEDRARGSFKRRQCRSYPAQKVKKEDSLPIASADVNIKQLPIRKKIIDCVAIDLSEIQYNEEDIITGSFFLDEWNPFTEKLRNPLKAKRLAKLKNRKNEAEKPANNIPGPQNSMGTLQEVKTTSSVAAGIPDQETPHTSTWRPFPKTLDEVNQIMRQDSFRLLKIVAKKSNPRRDTVKHFNENPYKNLLPVKLSVIKKSKTSKPN